MAPQEETGLRYASGPGRWVLLGTVLGSAIASIDDTGNVMVVWPGRASFLPANGPAGPSEAFPVVSGVERGQRLIRA